VCPDFTLGGGKMKGSLRRPVKVAILDGSTVRWERVILGKRTPDDASSRFVVEDDDETYTVRSAQCSNQFAPKRVEEEGRSTDRTSSFSCGEATTYNEVKLEVRQGDPSSRVINWVAPPDPACWEGSKESGTPPGGSASAQPKTPPP
jgi:hypothetical protein